MSNIKKIGLRFNLDRCDHKLAWDIIHKRDIMSANAYMINAILDSSRNCSIGDVVREVISEFFEDDHQSIIGYQTENRVVPIQKSTEITQADIDSDAMDFLNAL